MRRALLELRPGPHRYLAGLWEDALPENLVWTTRRSARRSSQYRAPTWSWACLDGDVSTMWPVEVSHFTGPLVAEVHIASKYRFFPNEFKVNSLRWNGDTGQVVEWINHGQISSMKDRSITVLFDTLEDIQDGFAQLFICASPLGNQQWFSTALALVREQSGSYRRIGAVTNYFHDKDTMQQFVAKMPKCQVTIV
ncbi:hypothetical protein BX600DRAFT_514824 [Xylariales sp. PMI_506]|nr:hypothetical protein BX600DRAFT_514824 [Xylariales sp. PMI_506]